MKLNEILSLIDRFDTSNLSKLSVQIEDASLLLEKEVTIANENKIVVDKQVEEVVSKAEIKSPLAGVFYKAASPESEAFVKLGQEILVGDVVCLVEAMKMINEVKSTVSGKVVRILADNEQIVSFDEVLFEVEPC